MPAPLRLLLVRTPSRIKPNQKALFSTCIRNYAASKYPNIAAFVLPEFRTAQLSEIPPDELFKSSFLPSAPDNPLQDELTALFTKNPPTFQYAESDFYKLKKNTRVPEVCVLGRSNVGKSSFVNALANRHNNVLAYVSSKAGKTRAINTYGFGPPPLPKDIAAQAAEYKGKEDIPTHAFYLVDMPGYGYASLKDWGRNITLYLTKRAGVKGAIVLIDAEVGPKQTDLQLLELLSTAGKRTAIVLTKADKVRGGLNGLRETCTKLWDAIIEIEKKQEADWPWEREIFVTAVGARDYQVVSSTVTTGRLAVARLAGLVDDNRPKPEKNKKWTGKIVSFDDLEYAPSKEAAGIPQRTQTIPTLSQSPAGTGTAKIPKSITSAFADLERASAGANQGSHRIRPRTFGSQRLRTAAHSHARAFHSSTSLKDEAPRSKSQPPNSRELCDILDDFLKELKFINTTGNYARNNRRRHDLRPPPPSRPDALEEDRLNRARYLQNRFPQQTERIQAVRAKRETLTARKARMREESLQESKTKEKEIREALKSFGSDEPADSQISEESVDADDSNVPLSPEAFDEAFVTSPGLKENKKQKKKGSKKKKGKGAKAESEPEPLDDFEAKFSSVR
ncbi:vacuolar protein sorting-associated protein 26 [Hypoxylon texense]